MSAPVMAGVAMATLALGLGVVTAAHTLEASARAAGAADAAALAAADAVVGYLEAVPCEIAGAVAAAVNSALESCEIHAASGQVRVGVSVQTIFGRAHAHARAGPEVAYSGAPEPHHTTEAHEEGALWARRSSLLSSLRPRQRPSEATSVTTMR